MSRIRCVCDAYYAFLCGKEKHTAGKRNNKTSSLVGISYFIHSCNLHQSNRACNEFVKLALNVKKKQYVQK